jgi:superfamily II DNA/RNA helicase
MFDSVTEEIIKSSRALPGLDPNDIAKELTAVHVEIAAARLSLLAPFSEERTNLSALLTRLGRLADTYEAQVVLDINPQNTRAMAFVAASARQAMMQATRFFSNTSSDRSIDEMAVGPDISSALLFLIAERSSDAYEAARFIRTNPSDRKFSSALAKAIQSYAQGKLSSVTVENSPESFEISEDIDATELLFCELLKGIVILAQIGLGAIIPTNLTFATARFEAVIELSKYTTTLPSSSTASITSHSVYSGPFHLAALLLRAATGMASSSVVSLPAPSGSDATIWETWLKTEALRWPFLWENHRDAISLGYLNSGKSLVMTTPTGSGKTTLSSLKIAAVLTAGKSVLYLAPTHALVSQVEHDLNERMGGLEQAKSIDDISLDDNLEVLPSISVVTPERCFALLTFAPGLFSNVGLLVFDECHLLGASDKGSSSIKADRRSVDAMLCLLTFMNVNPEADYLLLSAMISNGTEVANWLQSLLGREVYSYDSKWKPTRQLRSSVVYKYEDIKLLERQIKASGPAKNKKPTAIPYGIFSLKSGWNPGAPDTLAIRAFHSKPVPLKVGGANGSAYLTANRNEVAASIATRLASSGLKVIVFCDSVTTCVSVAKKINAEFPKIELKDSTEQKLWRERSLAEIGTPAAMYASGETLAAVHHGELLPDERRLVESFFKDKNSGVNVLAATSTLAQGLNLPCEAVIIAGTDRLDESDPEEKRRSPLLPHEILNALGRAGRAGQAATGLSIIVPGSPINCHFDSKNVSDEHDLSIIFAASDQCLPLTDPISTLFDQIEVHGISGVEAQYLLRRLSVSLKVSQKDNGSFEGFARRTFGFYQKATANAVAGERWLTDRRITLTTALTQVDSASDIPWIEELAAKTGASATFISGLASKLAHAPLNSSDVTNWLTWLLDQLDPEDNTFDTFLRPETISKVFGRAITNLTDIKSQRMVGRESVKYVLELWLKGNTLAAMEEKIAEWIVAFEGNVPRATSAHAKVKRARRFSLRVVPDIGFLCGILTQVAGKIATENGGRLHPMLRFLPQLIRKGLPTAYHFAFAKAKDINSRTEVLARFPEIASNLNMNSQDDSGKVFEKVRVAIALSAFQGA